MDNRGRQATIGTGSADRRVQPRRRAKVDSLTSRGPASVCLACVERLSSSVWHAPYCSRFQGWSWAPPVRHQGHAPSDPLAQVHGGNESPLRASGEAVVPITESQGAWPVHHVPCSEGDGAGHTVGCRTVLCHATLMAPALDGAQRSPPRLVTLPMPAQALVGLSGSGMDRPPKRS